MAEMSFAPRMRAARGNQPGAKEDPLNVIGALGLDNAFSFMQGCVSQRPTSIGDADTLLVVDFPNRPAKMLAAALADYGPASLLKVQLCDLPRLPLGKLKTTEVIVEVHACSVNPTDWKQRKGTLSTMCPLSLPCVLGIDLAGKVVRAGDDAPFSEGDEIFGRQTLDRMRVLNGSYAEFCIVECGDIYKKPASLSMEEAAAVPHASLAAYAALARVGRLHEKRKQKDKAVLVLGGSGGVGTFAVQLAKHHFDCFTVASCSASNADYVKSLGADEALDYNDPVFLLSAGLTKFDVILDCVGGDDYFQGFKKALAPGGVYVTLVGNTRYLADNKTVEWTNVLEVRADYLVRQISNKLGAAENYHILTGSQLKSGDLAIIASLIEKETLRVILDSTFSLYDIVKAHERSETHHARGKIAVKIRNAKKGESPQVKPARGLPEHEQDVAMPLNRAATGQARSAPKQAYTDVRRRGGPSLGEVSEAQDQVSSEEDEVSTADMRGNRQEHANERGGVHGDVRQTKPGGASGGVVMDEAWQLPRSQTGSKKGVTYDQFRPPGVDSPQHTPPESPDALTASASFSSNSARSRNMADMMPPSLSRDDDVGGPSSALLGVGVRHSELAQRSGASRGAGGKAPDAAWASTLTKPDDMSAPRGAMEWQDKSPLPAPIGSPRSLAPAAPSQDASPPPSLLLSPKDVMDRERKERERLEEERQERERQERERELEERERRERERAQEELRRREREREREEWERQEREREREERERRERERKREEKEREREERERRERQREREEQAMRAREAEREERELQQRERQEQERQERVSAPVLAEPAPAQHPQLPQSEDVEDLTARLEALQQEVAASANRVKKLNQAPSALPQQAGAADEAAPREAGGRKSFTGKSFAGGLRAAPALGSAHVEAVEDESSDEDEDDEGEDDSEWARGSARGMESAHTPTTQDRGASPPPIDPMEIVAKRKALEEAAAEAGGAAIGAGSLFRRPTAAEMLRGAPLPSNPNLLHGAAPAAQAQDSSAARASKASSKSSGGLLAKAARSLSPAAPLGASRAKSPAPHPPPAASPRASAGAVPEKSIPVPVGAVVHEGVLRRKKEDHGRFEDPYKTACVCRLQGGILRVRLSHNGEVVGEEERFDLREWRLLPRSDKPDRFSLTRGMTDSDDDRNVISFKAENKAEGNKWTDHIRAATVALRNESKKPTGTAGGKAPAQLPAGVTRESDLMKSSPGVNVRTVDDHLKMNQTLASSQVKLAHEHSNDARAGETMAASASAGVRQDQRGAGSEDEDEGSQDSDDEAVVPHPTHLMAAAASPQQTVSSSAQPVMGVTYSPRESPLDASPDEKEKADRAAQRRAQFLQQQQQQQLLQQPPSAAGSMRGPDSSLRAPESSSMSELRNRQAGVPANSAPHRGPESNSLTELQDRQQAAGGGGAAVAAWGASGHRAPESSSLAELVERNATVAGAAAASANCSQHESTTTTPAAPSAPATNASSPPVPTGPPAGVGIVFKESRRNSTTALLVKSLAPGGPAEACGQIQVGDILLKVDGKDVDSTEKASKLILGEKGSKITMQFKRFAQDKVNKFSVTMFRGTAANLHK